MSSSEWWPFCSVYAFSICLCAAVRVVAVVVLSIVVVSVASVASAASVVVVTVSAVVASFAWFALLLLVVPFVQYEQSFSFLSVVVASWRTSLSRMTMRPLLLVFLVAFVVVSGFWFESPQEVCCDLADAVVRFVHCSETAQQPFIIQSAIINLEPLSHPSNKRTNKRTYCERSPWFGVWPISATASPFSHWMASVSPPTTKSQSIPNHRSPLLLSSTVTTPVTVATTTTMTLVLNRA